MIEDNNGPSLEESINKIYKYLYARVLTAEDENIIKQYIDAYNETLRRCIDEHTPDDDKRFELLSGPLKFIKYNFPEGNNKYPAIEIIINGIGPFALNEGTSPRSNNYVRTLRNPNIPSIQDKNPRINGFTSAFIIVFFTIWLGILLGTLLFFIK